MSDRPGGWGPTRGSSASGQRGRCYQQSRGRGNQHSRGRGHQQGRAHQQGRGSSNQNHRRPGQGQSFFGENLTLPNIYVANDSIIVKPKTDGTRPPSLSNAKSGTLVSLVSGKHYGFIRPRGGGDNIYFHFVTVINETLEEITLVSGLKVKYTLALNGHNRALNVFLVHSDGSKREGHVIKIEKENLIITGDILVHKKKLPQYLLPFKIGDTVTYDLPQTTGQQEAFTAKLVRYAPRVSSEILQFFKTTLQKINTSLADQVLVELLSSDPLLLCIGSHDRGENCFEYFLCLSHFVTAILEACRSHKALLGQALAKIFNFPIFQNIEKSWDLLATQKSLNGQIVGKSGLKVLAGLLLNVIKLLPEAFHLLAKLVNDVIDSTHLDPVQKTFFQDLIDALAEAGGLSNKMVAQKWQTMSTFPNESEILGDLMVADKTLPIVKTKEPYLTVSDYLNTNFLLLRAEIYSAVQRGIQDYKNGSLDQRDMNCYFEIALAGYYFTHSRMCLALQFTPARPVKNWAKSPQLMFGNLLCISPSGNFEDIIYATVAERDEFLLNEHSIIIVHLSKENNLRLTEIFDRLAVCGGRAVMVESPTYFNALHPALESLKTLDFDNFSLRNQIVFAKDEATQYCVDSSEFADITQGLDESQKEAFYHCLTNKLGIIQGPPGTGKTFIGAKLVQALLRLNCQTPILILTYKNHALDEFLKHLINKRILLPEEIIRVGGRSKEAQLNQCNLNDRIRETRVLGAEIFHAINCVDELKGKVRVQAEWLNWASKLAPEDILVQLTEDQIMSLLNANSHSNHNILYSAKKMKAKHGDLNKLMKSCFKGEETNKSEVKFFEAIREIVTKWLPNKQNIVGTRQLQAKLNQNLISASIEEEENDFDVEYVQQLQESRLSAFQREAAKKEKIQENLVIFKSNWGKSITYKISDFPDGINKEGAICYQPNIGYFDEGTKIRFIYNLILKQRQPCLDEFESKVSQLEIAIQDKNRLEEMKKMNVLRSSKVVAMTISGAGIYQNLLQKLEPETVISEEAAEILEPSHVISLSPKTKHVILIGDHKQLRPKVETHELVKKCSFDVSMMERLISCGFPYKALKLQNRMRPEFSALLRDIYPELEDNLDLVMRNKPLPFMKNSMFFWTHSHAESKSGGDLQTRSKTNPKEAEMVVELALFFLSHKCSADDITILTAYLGQTKIIRKLLHQAKEKFPRLFGPDNDMISVQTIDMYQGDENKYVIVSLVRSQVNTIGFLDSWNRRCVAQSRAKCGLYFVGNVSTISKKIHGSSGKESATVWKPLIEGMQEKDCVASSFETFCPDHPKISFHTVESADTIQDFLNFPQNFCKVVCDALLPCEIHRCELKCFPKHNHQKCDKLLDDIFPICQHPIERRCWEDINTIKCTKKVSHIFEKCGHPGSKKCYVDASKLTCQTTCTKTMDCGEHPCKDKCGSPHDHDGCQEETCFIFPVCRHPGRKKCFETIDSQHCEVDVLVVLQKCKHEVVKPCSKAEKDVICINHQCSKMNNCGQHRCNRKCGEPHDHNICDDPISFIFPKCKHPSSHKKKCSEPIIWKCRKIDYVFHPKCGHEVRKECWISVSEMICHHVPCIRTRECGHPCTNTCGEDCNKGDCVGCKAADRKKMEIFKHKAKMQIRKIEQQLSTNPERVYHLTEIKPDGPTSSQYVDVCDKVLRYVQPMHRWYPKITKIDKVSNLDLEQKFEEAKLEAFGDHIGQKFHGTGSEGVKNIPKNGFRMPKPPPPGGKPGMYGQGIYFATDSSKSAQEIYTKGSHKLLLCDVLIGNTKTVTRADNSLGREMLRQQQFDSVYAIRDSKTSGGVENDEYVIFDPRQAIVRYIIHYSMNDWTDKADVVSLLALANKNGDKLVKKNMKPSRSFDMNDPFQVHFRAAEYHFLKMQQSRGGVSRTSQIESIDIVCNPKLEKAFNAKKAAFVKSKIKSDEVLAFHGTPSGNIESILKENLQMKYKKKQVHGPGIYFSEFPDTSMSYGDGLLLFRTLPGKEFEGRDLNKPKGFHSKKVGGNAEGFGNMLIIEDSDQFVPYAVYHLKK